MQKVQKYENEKRGHPNFQEGDEILCRRFHFSLGAGDRRKQEFQYDGPYLIKRMLKPSVAEVEGLPPGMPTSINVQYLKKYVRLPDVELLRNPPPPPTAIAAAQGTEWEVDKILRHRGVKGHREFFVKWKGYPTSTWVRESLLVNSPLALERYWQHQAPVVNGGEAVSSSTGGGNVGSVVAVEQ